MKMEVNKVVQNLFESLCDSWQQNGVLIAKDQDNVGLHVCIRFNMENHGYEKDGNTHRPEWERTYNKFIHFIILSGRKVFVNVSDNPHLKELNPADFDNTSNHDSCWRSDGLRIINNEYYAGYKHCFEWMPDGHRPIPLMAHDYVAFGWLDQQIFRYVRVTKKYDGSHHYRLNDIRPVAHTIHIGD